MSNITKKSNHIIVSKNVQICPWSPKGPFLTFAQKKCRIQNSVTPLFPSNFFQSSNICQRLTSPAVEVKRESSSLLLGFPKKRKRRKKKKDLVVLGVLGPFRSRTLHPPSCPAPPFRSAYTLVKVSVRRGACEDATAVRKSARAPSRVLSTS